MITAGKVWVAGKQVLKPAQAIDPLAEVTAEQEPWVSRAAYKLIGALDESGTKIPARVLDAGASTGGFTQVCLSRGAERVYAVDVGHAQLAPQLREDPRVSVRERLHLRDLRLADIDHKPVDLIVADVSFISLTKLLSPLSRVLGPEGTALLLVKPQFEVGRANLGAGGVVRSESQRETAVAQVVAAAEAIGWEQDWQAASQLPGATGNIEYFVRFRWRH